MFWAWSAAWVSTSVAAMHFVVHEFAGAWVRSFWIQFAVAFAMGAVGGVLGTWLTEPAKEGAPDADG